MFSISMFALSQCRWLDHISFYQRNAIMRGLRAGADESLCIHFETKLIYVLCLWRRFKQKEYITEVDNNSSASRALDGDQRLRDEKRKSSLQERREKLLRAFERATRTERTSRREETFFISTCYRRCLVVYHQLIATVDCHWEEKLVNKTWLEKFNGLWEKFRIREKFLNVADWFNKLQEVSSFFTHNPTKLTEITFARIPHTESMI